MDELEKVFYCLLTLAAIWLAISIASVVMAAKAKKRGIPIDLKQLALRVFLPTAVTLVAVVLAYVGTIKLTPGVWKTKWACVVLYLPLAVLGASLLAGILS